MANTGEHTKQRTVTAARQTTGQLGAVQSTYNPVQHTVRAKQARTDGAGSQLLTGLANMLGKYGEMRMASELERAYVDGQQQRHLGKAEADLDSNFLTRPFVRGGWRDQNYILDQAATQTRIQALIDQRLHETDPAGFQEFLAQERAEFYKNVPVQGTTARLRAKAINAQMQMESQLTDYHTKKHAEYSSFRNSQNINAGYMSVATNLASNFDYVNGLTDPEIPMQRLYTLATEGIETMNPMLRTQVQVQLLSSLYADGHTFMADSLRDALQDSPNQPGFTVEQEWELGKAKKAAEEADKWSRPIEGVKLVAALRQRHKNGEVITPDEVLAVARAADARNAPISPSEVANLMVMAAPAETDNANRAADAYLRGDLGAKSLYSTSESSTANAAWLMHKRNRPVEIQQRASEFMFIQAQNGSTASQFSEDTGNYMAALINDSGTELEGHTVAVQHVQGVIDAFKLLQEGNKTYAVSNLLVGIKDERAQSVLSYLVDNPELPIQSTLADGIAEWERKLQLDRNPTYKQADMHRLQREVSELSNAEFSSAWGSFKAFFHLGESSITQNPHMHATFKREVNREAMLLAGKAGYRDATAEQLYTAALAKVQQNTVTWYSDRRGPFTRSDVGVVILTDEFRNSLSTVAEDSSGKPLLGGSVPSASDIRAALAERFEELDAGTQYHFETTAGNRIEVYQRDVKTQSEVHHVTTLTPQDLAESIRSVQLKDIVTKQGAYDQMEFPVTDPTTPGRAAAQLRITGQNSIGLPNGDVLEWDKSMIGFEGFRWHAYEDPKGSGRYSVGVGHQLPPDYKPSVGKASLADPEGRGSGFQLEQLQKWYWEDRERALSTANRIAKQYGFADDPGAVLAVAGMAFQLKQTSLGDFAPTFRQIAAGQDYAGLVNRAKGVGHDKPWEWTTQTENRVDEFLRRLKPRFDRLQNR